MSKDGPDLLRLCKKDKTITPMLYDLLSCVTPHPNYETIIATIKKYLPKDQNIWSDGIGNLIIKVGEKYTTMFSCHIDMVFREKGLPKSLDLFIAKDQEHAQANFIWAGIITEFEKEKEIYRFNPTTLGADDKAGIFILINMIRAKVPGLYLFHVGEEVGGIGSLDIKNRKSSLLKNISRAIAFDRMDYLDIIDRQRGGVCCSYKFVDAFSEQLNDLIITPNKIVKRYKGATGTFTDTANYTKLIPECTNLSVGYFSQHTEKECLDSLWLETILMPALLKVNWEDLPTERIIHDDYVSTYYSRSRLKGRDNFMTPKVKSIGKYTLYKDIDYNTLDEKLPPWTPEKGYIKSCTDLGMRALIRKYLKGLNSNFTVQNDMLNLLKKNSELAQTIEAKQANVVVPFKKKEEIINREELLFDTITLLTNKNFKVYKDNYSLYATDLIKYADTLEWAWEDLSQFEDVSFTMGQMLATAKDILAEIMVINTTLLAEINYGNGQSEWPDVDEETRVIITQSIKFFKDNWFMLGYNTYVSVQDEFKQIRNRLTKVS